MNIDVNVEGKTYILRLAGRWDAFSASAFEQRCAGLLEEGMRNVVIDMGQVDYLSSFGLRAMLNLGKTLEPLGGNIVVAELQPQVSKVFRGSGFDRLFRDFPSVESATKAIGGKK